MRTFFGLSEDSQWRSFLIRWMSVSLIFHLIAALFSIGHHSADEYFQILEFLSYKLGKTPAPRLPIEFWEQMRPWLQPGICWVMVQIWKIIGVNDPFVWATSFRMFSGLVGWASTVALAICSRFWIANATARKFAVLALTFVWYFPALHARPSSENLSGSTFVLGLCLAYLAWKNRSHRVSQSPWIWACTGAFLGLSFEFRYQAGFMIVGLVAWLAWFGVWKRAISFRSFVATGFGLLTVILLGTCIDRWGYGQWVLSPLRYYEYNIGRGEMSKFGHAPWWDVFRMSMTETWPILGPIIAFSTIIAWIRHPKHILTWSYVPFFLVHEVIAHKEMRFFFPIAMAGPIHLTLSLYSEKTQKFLALPKRGLLVPLGKLLLGFIVFLNSIALVALLFVPFARTVQFFRGVYYSIPKGTERFELYTQDRDPYLVLGNPTFFYRPDSLVVHKYSNYSEIRNLLETKKEPVWLFETFYRLPEQAHEIQPYCRAVYQTLPEWLEAVNWTHWMSRTLTWTLFRCEKQ